MRTLSSPTASEVAGTVTRPGYLVEMLFSTPLRLTTSGALLSWDSKTWVPWDVQVQGLEWDGKADQKGRLAIGNTGLELSAIALGEGTADKAVSIWQFWGAATASADPVLVFRGVADGCDITPDKVTFTLMQQGARGLFSPRRLICAEQGFLVLPAAGTILDWAGEKFQLRRAEN